MEIGVGRDGKLASPIALNEDPYYIKMGGGIATEDDRFATGDEFLRRLDSLDAIRVSAAYIDNHLADLLWFQQRLVDFHETLMRSRNMTRKTADGIARSIHIVRTYDDLLECSVVE